MTRTARRVAQRHHLEICKSIEPITSTTVGIIDGDSLGWLLRENGVDAHDVILAEVLTDDRYRWEARDSEGEPIAGAFTLWFRNTAEGGIEVVRDIYLRDGHVVRD